MVPESGSSNPGPASFLICFVATLSWCFSVCLSARNCGSGSGGAAATGVLPPPAAAASSAPWLRRSVSSLAASDMLNVLCGAQQSPQAESKKAATRWLKLFLSVSQQEQQHHRKESHCPPCVKAGFCALKMKAFDASSWWALTVYIFPIMSLQCPFHGKKRWKSHPAPSGRQDFIDLFDTLPPGSDEIVALTEVLEKVKDPIITGRGKPGFHWTLWDDFTLTYRWKTWYTNKPTKHLLKVNIKQILKKTGPLPKLFWGENMVLPRMLRPDKTQLGDAEVFQKSAQFLNKYGMVYAVYATSKQTQRIWEFKCSDSQFCDESSWEQENFDRIIIDTAPTGRSRVIKCRLSCSCQTIFPFDCLLEILKSQTWLQWSNYEYNYALLSSLLIQLGPSKHKVSNRWFHWPMVCLLRLGPACSGDLAVKGTENDRGKFKNSLQLPHSWMSKLSKPWFLSKKKLSPKA